MRKVRAMTSDAEDGEVSMDIESSPERKRDDLPPNPSLGAAGAIVVDDDSAASDGASSHTDDSSAFDPRSVSEDRDLYDSHSDAEELRNDSRYAVAITAATKRKKANRADKARRRRERKERAVAPYENEVDLRRSSRIAGNDYEPMLERPPPREGSRRSAPLTSEGGHELVAFPECYDLASRRLLPEHRQRRPDAAVLDEEAVTNEAPKGKRRANGANGKPLAIKGAAHLSVSAGPSRTTTPPLTVLGASASSAPVSPNRGDGRPKGWVRPSERAAYWAAKSAGEPVDLTADSSD